MDNSLNARYNSMNRDRFLPNPTIGRAEFQGNSSQLRTKKRDARRGKEDDEEEEYERRREDELKKQIKYKEVEI
jgi:hypothetical protein